MRRSDGFTLIELMITVAIIGLLASLAIPSWQVAIARSRQVEAKGSLSAIHTLETSYHGEQNTYGTLSEIGFVPDGGSHYQYCVKPPRRVGYCINATAPLGYGTGDFYSLGGAGGGASRTGNPHYDSSTFEADAYGVISTTTVGSDFDSWLIDQQRMLLNYRVGY